MRHIISLTLLCIWLAASGAVRAAEPEVLWKEARGPHLQTEGAVVVKNLRLKTGVADFHIEEGLFFPAATVGGKIREMVFLGQAQLLLEAPDSIEGQQLELFTGNRRLQETVSEAVLVIAQDSAVEAIFSRPEAEDVAPEQQARAEEVFHQWREGAERRLLGVRFALVRDALEDPFCSSYFAGRFKSEELGDFLFLYEPEEREQVTVGQFVGFELEEKERAKIERRLHRAQQRGRLMGVEVADLGTWDTWLSASRRNVEGVLQPGLRAFEPKHYEIEGTLQGPKLELAGQARLHLQAATSVGRFVRLEIDSDLQVRRVGFEGEKELFFGQVAGEVLVYLPRVPAAGETIVLEVDYDGLVLEKVSSGAFSLRNTTHWYPHAGVADRATYDVTLHWPKKFDVIASGKLVDSGVGAKGARYERRRIDLPTFAVSFELGKFEVIEAMAGDVAVTLGVDRLTKSAFGGSSSKENQQEILTAIKDSLNFFESTFGPYPLDELKVVTVPRAYSQGLLGFVTLSTLNMIDDPWFTQIFGFEDRRTVIAHEIAHQWWGHKVPWQGYRDQWISEAMANYSAVIYARMLESGRLAKGPTKGWQSALLTSTGEGRPVEEIGPLVLGERLVSSHSDTAYEAIVYKKGAVVVDMLARDLGEELFLKVLKAVATAVNHRPIDTATFINLIEKASGRQLDSFAEQFIYGTGLPEVYYDYSFEAIEGGKWLVQGTAYQSAPYHFEFRLVEGPNGILDVARERKGKEELGDSTLVVPIQIAVYNPDFQAEGGRKRAKKGLDPKVVGNGIINAHIKVTEEETELRFQVDYEPKAFWLDRETEVFGRFFDQRRFPKRMLYYRGLDAASAGGAEEAIKLFQDALRAEVMAGPSYDLSETDEQFEQEARILDIWIHLGLMRLHLDGNRTGEAQATLEQAKKLVNRLLRYRFDHWSKVLEARLALQQGDAEKAFRILRKAQRSAIGTGNEGILVMAIAAQESGHELDALAALERAKDKGLDVSFLTGGQGPMSN
jgi:tetratricopeptide (TPR) repeat protein